MKLDKLHAFLNRYRDQSFETGINDCALFVADWVKELTGNDFSVPFRGRYQTDTGSCRLIKKQGYIDLADMVSRILDAHGIRRTNPCQAQRGDIAWIKNNGQCLCGIVAGHGVVALSHNGLITLPVTSIQIAWQIDEAPE